uniref:Uncharacterized protein n=1 Tax=Cucumis melo TaxID=3656 RepID=A0A9I9CYJ2_CUCME
MGKHGLKRQMKTQVEETLPRLKDRKKEEKLTRLKKVECGKLSIMEALKLEFPST